MNTTTTLSQHLVERLDLWDKIDSAYDKGLVLKAIELTKYVDDQLTPNIRKGYCL